MRPVPSAAALGLVLLAGALRAQAQGSGGTPTPEGEAWTALSATYGFDGLLNSKFNDGLTGLVAADLDGDGRDDLAVINNAKARIELMLALRDGEPTLAQAGGRLNELADETSFRRESFPTEEKVASLAVADVDGDGLGDLIFAGDSGRLTLALRDADGSYGRVSRHRLEETPVRVRAADLDGDGRCDPVVLGKDSTFVFLAGEQGRLGEAVVLPNATREADDLRLADLDGDGSIDLLYAKLESEWPFRWRLGRGGAGFGPELTARFTPIRGFDVRDVDGDGRMEIAAVRRRSGRLALLRWRGFEAGELPLSEPRVVAFAPMKDASRRETLVADLDGDGRADVLAAEPSAARVSSYRAGEGFVAETHPSLLGAAHPHLADLDADGRPELVMLSPDEQAVAIAALGEDGRPGFPRTLASPNGGELLALDVAPRRPGGVATIWLVTAEGKGRSRKHTLLELDPAGSLLGTTELGELKFDPPALRLVDIDRDGWNDALVFQPTEMPKLLRGGEGGLSEMAARQLPAMGLLKGLESAALAWADVDGDGVAELLVPGPNFARAVRLDAEGAPQVVEQCNLPGNDAQAGPVGAGDLDGDGHPEILVVERGSRSLVVFRREGEERVVAGRVDLGDFQPRRLWVADTDGDGRLDVVLESAERFAVVRNGGASDLLAAELDYELPTRNGSLDAVSLGDVNADGRLDAVMTDTRGHRIAIAAIEPEAIRHALRFAVFEGRLFEEGRGGREPRELVVADLTGDGLHDIALLVHDRVLVYPQEAHR